MTSAALPPDVRFVPPLIAPAKRLRRFLLMLPQFLDEPLSCWPPAIYHDAVTYLEGPPRVVFVCDPDLVKDVLLDRQELFPKPATQRRILGPLIGRGILLSEGAEWKWQRQTVAPLFRHADILAYVPVMAQAAEAQAEVWERAGSAEPRNIEDDMKAVTYAVISNTILAGGGEAVGKALFADAAGYMRGLPWSILYAVLDIPQWLPRPFRRRMRQREIVSRSAVIGLVRARRADAVTSSDLLARMIAARRSDTGEAMTDEEITDTLMTFLLAGHDTTAKTLGWALYLLSKSPGWQARVLAEIDAVVGEGPVTAAHVADLASVNQVIKETLRLFPAAPQLTRHAVEDLELGGIAIPAGTLVDIPVYAIHRHRALWSDPDAFDPGRFSADLEQARPRYQFIPFGGGPRVCIGAAFALIEAAVLLASFTRRFRFDCAPGFAPVPSSRITLGTRDGLPMRVSPR